MTGSPERRIAAIATCQRGRVARRQILAAGLTPDEIDARIRSGRLIRLHAGVYAVGHLAPVPFGRETAALLAVSGAPLLTGSSAALVWGVDLGDPTPDADADVHVLVPPGWASRRAGISAHRSRTLAPADRRIRHGLPVVSPARMLLDLARELDLAALVRVHDELRACGLLGPADLAELLRRAGSHPGRGRARQLLAQASDDGFSRSEAERRLRGLVASADLPAPRRNARVHGFEVDLLWPEASLVVEVDGYRFHASRSAFERDRHRDARLGQAGLTVLRVTWRQLESEPMTVVARIAAALVRGTR